ncbi:MAG: hypothetical protein ACUBOA_02765 [Candidatus Loosdrechtia sp.]|uniref:hypothetical protein n=1 Tax=Candidatus Loosdrechtia sp. TaxID=3101272 RepID=UPI003A6AB75E|nr:MAG: hypothetical protein QY305_02150 [Candidatus Jettenia sp. AMX2]
MRHIICGMITLGSLLLGMPTLSNAFNVALTPDQVQEANEYGRKYKGMEIFTSDVVKSASFGGYPKKPGGLVVSKYISIALTSAMKAMNDKVLTDEEIKEILESTTFKVFVKTAKEIKESEDISVMLIQGTDTIFPQKTEPYLTDQGKKRGVKGFFPYDKIDPNAVTTIVVKIRSVPMHPAEYQKEYQINFSDVK